MVIMWPNSDGTVTLSQRKAPFEVQPTLDSNPPRVATFSKSLTSVRSCYLSFMSHLTGLCLDLGLHLQLWFHDSGTSITSGNRWLKSTSAQSNGETKQSVIYAFSSTAASSSAQDATLSIHRDHGILNLNLGKGTSTTTGTSAASTPTSGTPGGSFPSDGRPLLPFQRLVVAHAIFCVVGFLLLLPGGALLARYLRTFSPKWFTGHWLIQFAICRSTVRESPEGLFNNFLRSWSNHRYWFRLGLPSCRVSWWVPLQ